MGRAEEIEKEIMEHLAAEVRLTEEEMKAAKGNQEDEALLEDAAKQAGRIIREAEKKAARMIKDSKKQSKKIVDDAKRQAGEILEDAKKQSDIMYASSLEYVDDMLSEVELVALRAKESARIIMKEMLEEFDYKLDVINRDKEELLKQLQDLSADGIRPAKKQAYDIKVDESYFKKAGYEIKTSKEGAIQAEVRKPAKQPYEIKIADEWKDRIAKMEEEQERFLREPKAEKVPEPEKPVEEPEEGFQADDFDLDAEYFSWLSEEEPGKK